MNVGKKPDRRVARTQSLVLAAFRDLILERGYDGFTARELIDQAGIGHSTFYDHFENKDDVFERSVAVPLGALADAFAETAPSDGLRAILDHFWENRVFAGAAFAGTARVVMERVLAGLILARLQQRERSVSSAGRTGLPLSLVAAHLAGSQLALVSAWIQAQAPCDSATLGRALCASGAASARALLETAESPRAHRARKASDE